MSDNMLVLKRDSFSDRFCDDLCELLLNFLSFEDKICLECVSKQFQRCVYNRQTSLVCQSYDSLNNLGKILSENESEINLIAFESVLKKCKFINNIDICFGLKNSEEVLQIIIKFCNNLKQISFDFKDISENTLTQFGTKFGQSLRTLTSGSGTYKQLLNLCPNIETLHDVKIDDLVNEKDLLLTKLKDISITFSASDNNEKLFETFVDKYKNTLKYLFIDFKKQNYKINPMKQISLFNSLEIIYLSSDFNIDFSFIESLKSFALNCSQLKQFYLHLSYIDSNNILKVFDIIKYFPQLINLDICFTHEEDYKEEISVKSLEDCKQLTHLFLNYPKLSDQTFKDIDIYLPKLKSFTVITHTRNTITDETMKSLSKLKHLTNVFISAPSEPDLLITDLGLIEVINNCEKIQSINFYESLNITHKTIDALISLALKKPRICFKHRFNVRKYEENSDSPVIDMKSYDNLPQNMKLKVIFDG